MTREAALHVVDEFVTNPRLRTHMLAVEAAMRAYARIMHGDEDEWGMVGLLHDFDWEIHPTADEHPRLGQSILEQRGVPAPIRQAIMAHAPHTGVVAQTDMEKAILAVDELTGFIVACALVQPNRTLAEVDVASVLKKMKSKSFATQVNRDDIIHGAALLGRSLEDHIAIVLHALQSIHQSLGL